MQLRRYLLPLAVLGSLAVWAQENPRRMHLFILSGQSNMAALNPDLTFKPALAKALPDDVILVVKDAENGKAIENWCRPPKPAENGLQRGALYQRLLQKVTDAVKDRKPDTVTFVWMQGEADARDAGAADYYEQRLTGLLQQLRTDLRREDIGVVLGRLSDYGLTDSGRPSWVKIREIQMQIGSQPRVVWVDTDDLNGPKNDLHYNKDGYAKLGERFAAKAVLLIKAGTGVAK